MNRDTIDFGIDLGTTNSEISVLNGVNPEVIKNNLDMDITPSAVHIDKQGKVHLGKRALSKLEIPNSVDDVYTEFKRRMGSDFVYPFKSSGLKKTPEELSAEVLMSLKADVMQRMGEDVQAAVITIPAAFEQRQCAATKQAGELAGFQQTALLQEPVAASLAYGFQREISKKTFWLVFDFGGGTFDAAIMKAEDGDIQVVNHGGDNFLGGADIDWAIVENIVIPKVSSNYNLPNFKRGNPKWRSHIARIKRAVEEAKILLSRAETANLESCRFSDDDGNLVDIEDIELTRNQVSSLAEPLIIRASEICLRVLKEKGLDPSAIERTILVGGPTLAPYFREILTAHLGIQLDFSVDPLTVVSRGAAVFAGTQRIDKASRVKAKVGQFDVTMNYNPVGPDEDPRVSGEVASKTVDSVNGYTIELVNRTTGSWRSGKITLKEDGKFTTRLIAEPGDKNVFDLVLCSPIGTKQETVPSQFGYTIGVTVKEQIVCNAILLEKAGNGVTLMVESGTPYPFKKKQDFITAVALHKGTDEELRIPVVEAKRPVDKADHCVPLGTLIITGRQIRRDVPAGSDIEVKLSAKGPGTITVTALLSDLDEEYEVTLEYDKKAPESSLLETKLSRLEDELESTRSADSDVGAEELDKAVELVEKAKQRLNAAGDDDAARQAQDQIIELRMALDNVISEREWPTTVEEAQGYLVGMDRLVTESGNASYKKTANDLRESVEKAIAKHNLTGLTRAVDKVKAFYFPILFAQPEFLKGYLAHLYQKRAQMQNVATANRLFNEVAVCMDKDNVEGMGRIIPQLLHLLPEDVQEEVQRGYGSGITQ